MLQESISNENILPSHMGKNVMKKGTGLKQRSKALNDVMNTIQSHSSSNLFSHKKDADNPKKAGILPSFTKSTKGFTVHEDASSGTDDIYDLTAECHNHAACVEANDLDMFYPLEKYRLSKTDIDFYGNIMNLFVRTRVYDWLETKEMKPLDDLNESFGKSQFFEEEDMVDDDFQFTIPYDGYM